MRILVIEGDRSVRDGCTALLAADGHRVTAVRGDEAADALLRGLYDLLLLDVADVPMAGMELLQHMRAHHPRTLVVMTAADPSVADNIRSLRAGAWDYLGKPITPSQLQLVVGRAVYALEHDAAGVSAAPNEPLDDGASDGQAGPPIVGSSPEFRRAMALASRVAPTNASVMVTGESGTGKEVLARFIHARSLRARRALIPVNCAALPEPLLESEMFGHRRGAFTGADRDKMGLLEAAHRSTLFLDELTEMSHPIQAKLLRVLQDGMVRRLGGEGEEREVDVRIITATNRSPEQAVRAGELREDLFYRLWVFPIHLPPLRERPSDIPDLARHFLRHYWLRHHGPVGVPQLTQDALGELASRAWPGNVRELQNTMERVAITAEPLQRLQGRDLPASQRMALVADGAPRSAQRASHRSSQPGASLTSSLVSQSTTHVTTHPELRSLTANGFHEAKERCVTEFERGYLEQLVKQSGSNLSRAARMASIDRATLYRLLEKHGLQRETPFELADRGPAERAAADRHPADPKRPTEAFSG